MSFLANIGLRARERFGYFRYLAGTVCALVRLSFKEVVRRRTIRDVLARQILFTGVEASGFIILISLLIGVSVVVQSRLWLVKVGQSALLGPILVTVIIGELGPLLVNFIVIGRSGTAIATEMGSMRVSGEVGLLDSQGLDPLVYLVWPRVIAVTASVFTLAVVFVMFSFFSGYLSGAFFFEAAEPPGVFIRSVFEAITPRDVANFLAKSILPGLLVGTICCLEGLSATARHELPMAATRAVVKSVTALVLALALISVLTYA